MFALLATAVLVLPVRATSSPTLDGRLDETVWQTAKPFTELVQKNPDAGAPASEPTTVRILYDDDALWIGIDCVQERSPIIRRLTRRDRQVNADRVEIDLDSRATRRDAFHFEVSAAGQLGDALRYDDTEINTDWDDNWEAQTAATPNGWSAEIRIPFRVLRYSRQPGQSWGVQVRRFIAARQETDELSPIPRGEAGETSRYGTLGPFERLPDHSSLEVRPFAVASVAHDTTGSTSPHMSLGGDLKWHITPTLTLDMTVNPDFGQVEADQQVLNLSTYETFYPEKRPFFLEGTDLFSAPIQVLYTRRIGRVPDAPVLPDGELARALPDPARLWSAAKLTGTAGGDTQVGALAAIAGADRVTTDDMAGAHDRIAEPTSAYGALRVRKGLGSNGYVGVFGTGVARFEGHDYPMLGPDTLCPDGTVVTFGSRCTHDAYVAGVDARWRSESGAYRIDGDLAASTIHGGPPRMQRDGIVIASGDTSPQGRIHAAKEDNGPVFDITLEADGRRFDPNDAGYLERANYIHTDWNVGWKDTTPGDFVRESTTQLEYFYWRNWLGERISGGYQVNTKVLFANYWQMFTELHWRPWHFDDREVGDGTALQRSGRLGWELSLETDPRKPVTVSWSQGTYFVAHGLTYQGDGDVTIHAMPQLDVELLPSVLLAKGEPRYVLTDPATGAHVFGRQDALAVGVTLRTTYTFTPRATLQLYGQLFGERVAYRDFGSVDPSDRAVDISQIEPMAPPDAQTNSTSTILNTSAVFRWEWRLGSTLYVVYSRSQGVDRAYAPMDETSIPWTSGLAARSAQVFLVKATYWW